MLHMLGGIAWAGSELSVTVSADARCPLAASMGRAARLLTRFHIQICLFGFAEFKWAAASGGGGGSNFLSTRYQSQRYHVACKRERWNEISKGERGLVERQQTAVDSNVFPLILQSHFEGRLSWTNSVLKLKCTKVVLDKRRPDAPEEKSLNQGASIKLKRFPKWHPLPWWPHQFYCQDGSTPPQHL